MHSAIETKDTRTLNWGNPGLVITCEHGGNRIPGRYRDLLKADPVVLQSHRGFDPGALSMAKELAAAFNAPLVASTVSRLLVDLNRSVGHQRLTAETIRKKPSEVLDNILKQHYQPYRAQAEYCVRQAIKDHRQAIHLSSHSFTPELDGKVRTADIGLLYDPVRPYEATLCAQWTSALKAYAPELNIRRNYPYEGKGDGLTSYFRKQFPADAYIGIELEINQKHIINKSRHWRALRKTIINTLKIALPKSCGGISL